jgi:hypothetical protein
MDAQQSGQSGRWQQEKRRKGWLWPLSGDGLSDEDEEYRAQLEAMGVDLVGSRAKEQQQQRKQKGGKGGDDVDFDQMDDRQVRSGAATRQVDLDCALRVAGCKVWVVRQVS